MAREMIFIFTYDVTCPKRRGRIARILEERGTRVQYSVFELRMTRKKAEILLDRLGHIRDTTDSIRMYCLTEQGRQMSDVRGGAPIPEEQEFWLL